MKSLFFCIPIEFTFSKRNLILQSGIYFFNSPKFFVFDGRVEYLFVATDRQAQTETCFDFFDRDFNHINVRQGHPNTKKTIPKPLEFEKMVALAEVLGKGIPHCRIDLYDIEGKIYFGEITFFHYSGFVPFDPIDWDDKFGTYFKN